MLLLCSDKDTCLPWGFFLSLSQDKVLSNKTPKLDRNDGGKEMKEKASKRKLPFTAGANGDQKDSDSGKTPLLLVYALVLTSLPTCDFEVGIKEEGESENG